MKKGVHGPLARSGNMPPPEFVYSPPPNEGLNILHQDRHILVLSKPANLLTVTDKEPDHRDSMETRARAVFPDARTVHRLDRGTSGVLVMALGADSHRHLGLQFERRKTSKSYTALVTGTMEQDEGTVDLPLRTDWYNRPKQMVDPCLGREATTRWRAIERQKHVTRMQLTPVTGQSHQLRVHMQWLSHPIVGDPFYAAGEADTGSDRLMLHAETLEIFHPASGERMRFEDTCPF